MILHGFVYPDSLERFIKKELNLINVYANNSSGNLIHISFDLNEYKLDVLGNIGTKQVLTLSIPSKEKKG
jgi:hypothetical protein